MFNILKDIKRGALPLGEIPGFVLWMIGQTFWFWLVLIIALAAVLCIVKF